MLLTKPEIALEQSCHFSCYWHTLIHSQHFWHLTHSSQSTAMSRLISWVGSPTAVRISSMVTSPALGILAAPTLARVAVILGRKKKKKMGSLVVKHWPTFFDSDAELEHTTENAGNQHACSCSVSAWQKMIRYSSSFLVCSKKKNLKQALRQNQTRTTFSAHGEAVESKMPDFVLEIINSVIAFQQLPSLLTQYCMLSQLNVCQYTLLLQLTQCVRALKGSERWLL